MNHRERLLTALNHGIPDKVPTFDWFDEPVIYGVAELLGLDVPDKKEGMTRHGEEDEEALELFIEVINGLGMDGVWHSYSVEMETIAEGYGRDKYGKTYMFSDFGEPLITDAPLKHTNTVKGFDMVSKLKESDVEKAVFVKERLPNHAHALGLSGPFQETWRIRGGMDRLMVDFITRPGFVHDMMRITTDFNKEIISLAGKYGFDFIMVDGDLAGNTTSLISLPHFEEFVFPYKKELCDHAHSLGLKMVKHCDGVVWPLMNYFIEAGFDGFHPVQPQCMDIGVTKKYLKDRVCVLGNIDCLDLLVFRGPEEVREAVRQTIEVAAPGGGYILCSSNSLHPGCKPENVIAMMEAVHEFGWYEDIAGVAPPAGEPPALINGTPPPRKRKSKRRRKSVVSNQFSVISSQSSVN